MKTTKTLLAAAVLGVSGAAFVLNGCVRAYDTPEYVEVETDETAFVLPLEGDTAQQAKFQSAKFLQEKKVSSKRVQISHRWSQTGRLSSTGQWIPAVKVIKVKRSPVTREWTAESSSGTARVDQAIWVESQDSVGFSMGYSVTAYIKEEDAASFLYWYPSGSLAQVVDSEVRARIQQTTGEVAAKYALDALRAKKQEMVDAARTDVTTFFAERGITITTVAMFGGMTYENKEIQAAIDKVFVAQQEKEVNKAKLEAQEKENLRLNMEATGMAEKAKLVAAGQAEARIIAAKAEAQSLELVTKAIKDGGPAVVTIRQLEIDKERIERWDGKYPLYFMGTGQGSPNLLLQVPTPPLTEPKAEARAAASAH